MLDYEQLAFICGIFGNAISLMVYLAPAFTFKRICRMKSTENFSSLPYQLTLFSCMLWLYYAFLKTDAILLITIRSIGCLIQFIYIFIYIGYATPNVRMVAIKLLVVINLVFICIFVITHFLMKAVLDRLNRDIDLPELKSEVLGWICVISSVLVFASPLSVLKQVYTTQNVEFLPVNLSYCLILSAVIWFCYGLFTKDIKIAIPNVLGFFLALLQISLYWYYKNISKVNNNDEEMQSVDEHGDAVSVDEHGDAVNVDEHGDAFKNNMVTP